MKRLTNWTYLSRFAEALFLTSCILSLSFKRDTMVSAFFLTLSPTSFPLGSTYSKLASAFTNPKEIKITTENTLNVLVSTVVNCNHKLAKYKKIPY